MRQPIGLFAMAVVIGTGLFVSFNSAGQTPEQAQAWEAQRLQALARRAYRCSLFETHSVQERGAQAHVGQ